MLERTYSQHILDHSDTVARRAAARYRAAGCWQRRLAAGAVIVSKPKKTPLTFFPHKWVPLKAAFAPDYFLAGSRDVALHYLNRDLRSGRLRSALLQISPDGKETMTLLKPSDWQQRTVEAP